MTKKQYVQFSKRIVVAVIASDFALCAVAILLVCIGYDMSVAAEVIKTYTQFATVVFVAYSGNSAIEKWLIHSAKAKAQSSELNTEDEDSSNG